MKTSFNKVIGLRRLAFGITALAVSAAAVMPALAGQASAAPVTARYVKMSSSSNTATGASYEIGFTTATAGTLRGIVVDFCANSPIIGDTTCTVPTGFSVGTPTVSVSASFTATGSWTGSSLNTNRTLTVTNATNTNITAGTAGTITVSTVTNPTAAPVPFYARIYTYTATAGATGYTVANPSNGGAVLDSGGVAMTTTATITVTAKVQETLTFCVYTTSCGTGTAVALGDGNGVLASNTTVYTGTSSFDLASNASTGVVVRLKGDTLKAGSFSLDTFGASCTADSAATGTEQFGLRLSTTGAGQTAVAPYNCAANSHGFDIASACGTENDGNVTCTYGDQIATTAGPTTSSTSVIEYAAKSASTTESGVYTADLSYIATGKY